ncbi:MAG: class I SAM-dependent methyltransferase [Elusimicrobia bacterium]|nr:class I SAM-dependent methyltransferase [Elusimicrobiota bacterium]
MTKREIDYWWRSQFEDNPTHRPAYQVKAQVDGVERFLNLEPRSRVLDLACGAGKQTLELSRRGHRVLGLDSLEAPLSEARHAARAEQLNVHFLKGDIRQLGYRGEFDAVVNLYSSFGYFPAERDDAKTLEGVCKGLKPGGQLLMDLLNKEWLMRHFEPNLWEQAEDAKGAVVLDQISFNFETGRLDNHRTIMAHDGGRTPSFVSVRVYTLTEIKRLIGSAGLTYQRVWGGFDGSAYGMDSRRMIVLAEKPKAEARGSRRADEPALAIKIKGRSKSRR